MILTEYSEKINNAETLEEKVNQYQRLNFHLGLLNDDEITVEWLPTDDSREEILIRLKKETGLLTVEYNCNHKIFNNIHNIKLNASPNI